MIDDIQSEKQQLLRNHAYFSAKVNCAIKTLPFLSVSSTCPLIDLCSHSPLRWDPRDVSQELTHVCSLAYSLDWRGHMHYGG